MIGNCFSQSGRQFSKDKENCKFFYFISPMEREHSQICKKSGMLTMESETWLLNHTSITNPSNANSTPFGSLRPFFMLYIMAYMGKVSPLW